MKRPLLLFFALVTTTTIQAQVADSSRCSTITAQFNSYFVQGQYAKALPLWRDAYANCPEYSKSIYDNGAALYEKLIAAENNAERRQNFVDSLLLIYTRQIKYFNEKGNVNGKKGLALYKFSPSRKEEAVQLMGSSVDETGERTNALLLFHYFQGSAQLYNDRLMTAEMLASVFYKVSLVYDANRGNPEYDDFSSKTTALFSVLFSCEMIDKLYGRQQPESKNDSLQHLREFVQLSYKRKCTESQQYEAAATKLFRMGPDPLTARSMAQLAIAKENTTKAAGYYNDAVELESDPQKKAILLMDAAEFQLQELKSFPQSRTMAQRAATFHPRWGRPWLFIGDLYFNSALSCADTLKGVPAYWAAADKYLKAKSVDPQVKTIADKKLELCAGFYPGKTELAAMQIKEGDPIETGCWIGEKTTVKYRK